MTVGEWLCHSDSPRCDALLACGALIVAELRAAVLAETQFTCSAGIGHNKVCCVLCEFWGMFHSNRHVHEVVRKVSILRMHG
jgi:nucleotidyltransferase/DNA polymerase involved in DNA repair